jgi:hypothetical protein
MLTATAAPTAAPSPTPAATASPPTLVSAQAAPPSPTPSGAWIRLSPEAGPPGTLVRVSGHIPGGPAAGAAAGNDKLDNGGICWAGCGDGLAEQAVTVTWSSSQAGDFSMQFTVPQVPWLAANGPRPLTPGDYQVGIQCVGPNQDGCAVGGAEAGAVFRLQGPTPDRCLTRPCASLQLTPAQAPPGTLVRVRGWAPLVQLIGGQPFGYTLVLAGPSQGTTPTQTGSLEQAPDGSLSGSFLVPLALPGQDTLAGGAYTVALQAYRNQGPGAATPVAPAVTVNPLGKGGGVQLTLAPTPFTITPALAWSSLPAFKPLLVQRSSALAQQHSFGVDPALQQRRHPGRLAYCAPGAIQVSMDGGATWSAIDAREVVAATAGISYTLGRPDGSFSPAGAATPECLAVTLDPQHPDSYYATFAAAQKPYGAPPIYFIGYVTTDGGKRWQVVPVPPDHALSQFGGFRSNQPGVQALFSDTAGPPFDEGPGLGQKVPFTVEQTADGGRTWAASPLACPALGPCATWGPAPNGIGSCAMHGYAQPIEISADGGRSWTVPDWPSRANACQLNELAALGPQRLALLAGPSDYPLSISGDGGKTWQPVALPPLPGSQGNALFYQGLQLLPTGALLSQAQDGQSWEMLLPGAANWCPLAGAAPPVVPDVALQAIGDRLWWLETGTAPGAAPVPRSASLSGLHCG